ncbi:MAG: hypothetical protein CMC98_01580 [Flavobacteriales bacterium]|nr:hypothetical protein [Flavobacteriales bacterium]
MNFWSDFKGFSLIKRKTIDLFRIYALKNSDGIIFENIDLERKCNEIYNVKGVTTTILPSINLNYEEKKIDLVIKNKQLKKGLFLCGWQKHKGVLKIPQIAFKLKQKNIKFNFILTAPQNQCQIHKEFNSLIQKYNVSEYISVIGNVSKKYIKSLYEQIDIVFLISKLESFSNNIIESWSYEKILMVSDEEWSKAICKDAAVYVNRNNTTEISNKINEIVNNPNYYENIISNGKKQLQKLNTIEEKNILELNFLHLVFKNKY